jgi:hypothetical protein
VAKKHIKECLISKISVKYPYFPDDFIIPYITDKDVRFLKNLGESSLDWVLMSGNYCSNVFMSKFDYFPHIKFLKEQIIMKTEVILPYNFERIVCSLYQKSEILKYSSYIYDLNQIEAYSLDDTIKKYGKNLDFAQDKNTNLLVSQDVYIPFLKQIKKNSSVIKFEYDKKNKILYYFNKPAEHSSFVDKSPFEWSKIRNLKVVKEKYKNPENVKTNYMCFLTFNCLKQISDEKCQFIKILSNKLI